MTKQEYLLEVRREIEALRDNLSEEQRNRLDIDEFNPHSPSRCIYGQACRGCFSQEATTLLEACRTMVWFETETFGLGHIFSIPKSPTSSERRSQVGVTTLEHYIARYPKYNEQIIAYLKRESGTLPDLSYEGDE